MKQFFSSLHQGLGIPNHRVSVREHFAAIFTSGFGIAFVAAISLSSQPLFHHSIWLVASMGATAVLVFALPHGPLSQPWAVLMGHTVSAMTGVVIVKLVGGTVFAAAFAVALAIGVMHLLRCIHPPGGATALSAVMLANQGVTPDWSYVFTPVLINALLIVVCAVLLNWPFRWRRYPLIFALAPARSQPIYGRQAESVFSRVQIRRAFAAVDGMADISDEDIQRLYQALRAERENERMTLDDLVSSAYYSNGKSGADWSIAYLKLRPKVLREKDILKIDIVAGKDAGTTQHLTLMDFLQWAKYRVVPHQNAWHRFAD